MSVRASRKHPLALRGKFEEFPYVLRGQPDVIFFGSLGSVAFFTLRSFFYAKLDLFLISHSFDSSLPKKNFKGLF